MPKKTFQIILGVAIVAAIIASGVAIFQLKQQSQNNAENSVSDSSETVEFTSADQIYAASSDSGNIGEKVIGDPSSAKVVVYDYADYACSHCAAWNFELSDLMEAYPGQIALVFRGADVGFKNGPAAARAATAAQLQGFWSEYKDLLFSDQTDWFYLDGDALTDKFVEYFETASGGAGDVAKFKSDLNSPEVAQRIEFEKNLAAVAGVSATPTFRIDGQTVPLTEVEQTIKSKIGA